MTPELLAQHEAHKARQNRINARAYKPPVAVVVQPNTDEVISAETAVEAPACVPQPEAAPIVTWFRMSMTSLSMRDIQEVTLRHYGISHVDMISRRRDKAAFLPRQVAMYLCRTLTAKTLPEIGRAFGGRDHTTVMHAVQKIGAEINKDADLSDDVDAIHRVLDAIEEGSHESRNANPSNQDNPRHQEAPRNAEGDAAGVSSHDAQAAS